MSLQKDSLCVKTPIRNGLPADEERLHLSSDATFEYLLDLCAEDVLAAFPATEVLYSSDDKTKRSEVYHQQHATPTHSKFQNTIRSACRNGFPRRVLPATGNLITEWIKRLELDPSTMSRVDNIRKLTEHPRAPLAHNDYLSLLSKRDREEVYQTILAVQERVCGIVCGTIPRPKTLSPPRAAGFNVFGDRVNFADQLTLSEAEALRP